MKLPVLHLSNKDINTFIKFWSKFYSYPLEDLYNTRIKNIKFSEEDIQQLFIWKNGMNLSNGKQKSLENKILSKINIINEMKIQKHVNINKFNEHFNNLTAVWKIFLLHLIKPEKYPIYDQHIHRTYNFIHSLNYDNISNNTISNKNKELFYFETYLRFIDSLENCNLKKLDEAFFAFGQFINTKTYVQLVE